MVCRKRGGDTSDERMCMIMRGLYDLYNTASRGASGVWHLEWRHEVHGRHCGASSIALISPTQQTFMAI